MVGKRLYVIYCQRVSIIIMFALLEIQNKAACSLPSPPCCNAFSWLAYLGIHVHQAGLAWDNHSADEKASDFEFA